MSVAVENIIQHNREEAYRNYCADALMAISINTQKLVGNGRYMSRRYADLFDPPKREDAAEVRQRLLDKMEEEWGAADG